MDERVNGRRPASTLAPDELQCAALSGWITRGFVQYDTDTLPVLIA
jgi:hypothetical protein